VNGVINESREETPSRRKLDYQG